MPDPSRLRVETSIWLWESGSHTSHEVWKTEQASAAVQTLAWLPGTGIGLALIRQPAAARPGDEGNTVQQLLRVTALNAQALDLTAPGEPATVRLFASPMQPLAVLLYARLVPAEAKGSAPRHLARLVRSDGSPGPVQPLPAACISADVQWARDGSPVVRCVLAGADGKPAARFFALSPVLSPLDKEPEAFVPADRSANDPAGLRLATTQMKAGEGAEGETLSMLWMETPIKSEKPRALVASDASDGSFMPGMDGVLYKAQGALWYAPMARLDRKVLEAMRAKARQIQVMNNGKQIGLALISYASDHDDMLPGPKDANEAAMSYLKNDRLLEGFNYTFEGGKLSEVENPAETEIGYVTSMGGRAVIYVDGHVVWKPEGR